MRWKIYLLKYISDYALRVPKIFHNNASKAVDYVKSGEGQPKKKIKVNL